MTSTTSYNPQGNAMIDGRNRTLEECLYQYVGQYQYEWTTDLPLEMMAYRSSIHGLTRDSSAYEVFVFPL